MEKRPHMKLFLKEGGRYEADYPYDADVLPDGSSQLCDGQQLVHERQQPGKYRHWKRYVITKSATTRWEPSLRRKKVVSADGKSPSLVPTVLKTTTSLSVSRVFEDAEWCFVMYDATPAHARRADVTNYSIITRKGRSRKPRRHYSSCTIGNSRWADVKAPVETWAPKASILSEESFIL